MFITRVTQSGAGAGAGAEQKNKTLNLVSILSKRLVSADCTPSTNSSASLLILQEALFMKKKGQATCLNTH